MTGNGRKRLLRIYFTSDDVARVRVADRADPMWEILLSLHLLRKPDGAVVFEPWKKAVRARLGLQARMLFDLAPPLGYSPDFLTPAAAGIELEPGIDAVLSTPNRRLRGDLAQLAAERRIAPWTRLLAESDAPTLHRLGAALRVYFDTALRPHWDQVRAAVEADRALRARAVLNAGSVGLLATVHPSMSWEPPVLTMASPYDRELHLEGRGLLLMPAFFCWRSPITLRDPELPPVVVYPVAHDLGWFGSADERARTGKRPLETLLGRRRATVLATIAANACSTSELARRLEVSPAAISQHAAVLRDSGLILTTRHRQSVYHSATPLGLTLLNGGRDQLHVQPPGPR